MSAQVPQQATADRRGSLGLQGEPQQESAPNTRPETEQNTDHTTHTSGEGRAGEWGGAIGEGERVCNCLSLKNRSIEHFLITLPYPQRGGVDSFEIHLSSKCTILQGTLSAKNS